MDEDTVVDPFANSPLGVDADTTPPEPDATPAPVPAEPPVESGPSSVNLSQEQYDALVEKAGNFDVIQGDDIAMSMLRQHYSGETMNTPDPSPAPEVNSDQNSEIQSLRSELEGIKSIGQQMQEQLATIAISEFAKSNPEFEANRTRIGEIMGQYQGITLDKALMLAKAEGGRQEPPSNSQPSPAPVQASVETNSAGLVPSSPDDLADLERKITNTKEVPDFEAAVKLALSGARKHHGVR